MNRIITILVTIFILLLLYIWISHVWGSDKPRNAQEIVEAPQNEMGDGLMADADTTALHTTDITEPPSTGNNTTSSDEFDTDRKSQNAVTDNEPESKPVVVEEKKKEEPKAPVTKPVVEPKKVTPNTPAATSKPAASKPATTSSKPAATQSKPVATQAKPATTSSAASSTGGKHLVIAGNFSQEHNAQMRVEELKRAGFKEAEVVNFDLSEYHTVCVGRFSDVNEARRLVKKLKDYHKIDAYVRIGS